MLLYYRYGIMLKSFKFRLYPTSAQENLIKQTFGCVRFIYNRMLADKIKHYQETGHSLNNTPAQYKSKYPWLNEVDSLALANAQLELKQAYKRFFQDPRVHFPRFKSRKQHLDAYTTNNQKGSVRLEDGFVRLPKIGFVKCRQHRDLPENSSIKIAKITRNASGKYYIALTVTYENQVDTQEPCNLIAIAFSKNALCMDSDGLRMEYPQALMHSTAHYTQLQKQFQRCQKGSQNQQKALRRLRIYQEKLSNRHKDLLHKLTFRLANTYDCIFLEELNVQKTNNAQQYLPAHSINLWKMLEKYLCYKLEERGKQLLVIDKNLYPRQSCHSCQFRNTTLRNLSISKWTCPHCGQEHNSDFNTAQNLLQEGKKRLSAS